jgi:hypothetical protein
VITPPDEPTITVDNLDVGQFVYLMLRNERVRDIIDTITSKVVLILGRFTPERKPLLDSIRDELRKLDYIPILFDFDKPASRDTTETISTLAHLTRFVIADITDAKSIPQELERIVPALPSVPIKPLLLGSTSEYGMFDHFRNYPWVLKTFRFTILITFSVCSKKKSLHLLRHVCQVDQSELLTEVNLLSANSTRPLKSERVLSPSTKGDTPS